MWLVGRGLKISNKKTFLEIIFENRFTYAIFAVSKAGLEAFESV